MGRGWIEGGSEVSRWCFEGGSRVDLGRPGVDLGWTCGGFPRVRRFSISCAKLRENLEDQGFMFFVFLPPIFRRFRPSHVENPIKLDDTYRLVSKMLNFMPCGSVLGHFCVFSILFYGSESQGGHIRCNSRPVNFEKLQDTVMDGGGDGGGSRDNPNAQQG